MYMKKFKLFSLLFVSFSLLLTSCENKKKPSEQVIEYENYTLYQDVSYADEYRNRFDIVFPKEVTSKEGVLVLIHGGAWVAGDKENCRDLMIEYSLKYKISVASIGYEYASERVHYFDLLTDINEALNGIKETASKVDYSLNKVMLMGGSAGAHLSLLYGYKMRTISPLTVKGVISLAGPSNLTDENFFNGEGDLQNSITSAIEKISGTNLKDGISDDEKSKLLDASPIKYINANTCPTLIAHGEKDDVVPYSNAITLKEKLDSLNIKNDLVSFPTSGHGLDKDEDSKEQLNNLIDQYMQVLK